MNLQDTSLEWALKHLRRYYDSDFYPKSFEFEAKVEKEAVLEQFEGYLHTKRIELGNSYLSIFESFDEESAIDFDQLQNDEKFKIITAVYEEIFEKFLTAEYLDVGLTRYLLRQAASYRYRNLVPMVLDNFETLLPVIREVVIYLDRVLSENQVQKYKSKFEDILAQEYIALPYVNIWVFYLLQN